MLISAFGSLVRIKGGRLLFLAIVAGQILQNQKVHAMFRNMSDLFLLVKCLVTSLPEYIPFLLLCFLPSRSWLGFRVGNTSDRCGLVSDF